MVNDPPLAFRRGRQQHFLYDLRQCSSGALKRTRKRIAAQGTKADDALLGPLARAQRHALIIDHDQRAVTLHDRTRRGKIQRYDRNIFEIDIVPDIEFGPVREREDAH